VHEGLQVKLLEQAGEVYVLARQRGSVSEGARDSPAGLKRLVHGLNALKRRLVSRDVLLQKIGALRAEAGRVRQFVKLRLPKEGEAVSRTTFRCSLTGRAGDGRGSAKARMFCGASLPAALAGDGARLWGMYMQLVHVEEAFKHVKGDLALRPIHHYLEERVEAHILVAFLGYALLAHLRIETALPPPRA